MADDSIPVSKACSKCGAAKPHTLDFFRPMNGGPKLRSTCRKCQGLREGSNRKIRVSSDLVPDVAAHREQLKSARQARQAAARRERYQTDEAYRLAANAAARQSRRANPERTKEWDRRNAATNKAAGSDYQKRRYASRDKAEAQEALRKWKAENPEKQRAIEIARNERIRAQKEADPEFRKKQNKRVRDWQNNKRRTDPAFREKAIAEARRWHAENKDHVNAYKRRVNAERRKNDVPFKIKSALRTRLRVALRGGRSTSAVRDLGCSIEAFRQRIETLFVEGMTWENWGRGCGGAREWHLDHIKPLASFDLTDPAQLAEACHYTNLQPLWASDNRAKGARDVSGTCRKSEGQPRA